MSTFISLVYGIFPANKLSHFLMELTTGWKIFSVILVFWVAKTTFAQTNPTSSRELCFPGNIYNNNLTLYGSQGTLKSPLVFYPLNSSCDWLITVPDGKIVKLSFDGYLDFPDSTNNTCITDYVEILDGKQSTSKSKGRFCATRLEKPVISSGRYMWVRFRADNIRQKNHWDQLPKDYMGFKATFTALDKPKCFDGQSVTAFYLYNTTITSPFYPSDYYSDVECTWRVTVDNGLSSGGYVVKVTFADFKLEPYVYEHCYGAGLEFYDGYNNTGSNLLGLYCGIARPEVIYSTGQNLYVRFYNTDRYFSYHNGFSFSISAVKQEEASGICRSSNGRKEIHSLSGSSGTFFTPGYPVPDPDDATCVWTITVPAGKIVKLTFEVFDLERLDHDKDYVQILDGKSSQSKELELLHGYDYSDMPDVYSTGRYMWVTFYSGITSGRWWRRSATGFKAHFEAVDPPVYSRELCFLGNIYNNNLTLTGSNGTLQSPLKDDRYPPRLNCDWLITVPEGKIVKLSFEIFELAWNAICNKDYVEILDGKEINSASRGRYCGYATPKDIYSSGRYMRVHFISDKIRRYNDDGFKATFTAEKKPTVPVPSVAAISKELCFPGNINNNDLELTGSHGTLQSPTEKHSGKYPPDSSCDWLITVPDGKIVKLSFDRFDLQPGTTHDVCTADYVQILDGKDRRNSEIKGIYCGHYISPEGIRSSGRYMRVLFISDSLVAHYEGFKATFTAEDKTRISKTLLILIIVTVAVFIAVICCVVCIEKRRKKRRREREDRIPMTALTTSALLPSPQAPPAVGYAPVPTNQEVQPLEYPYPLESPPPYPEKEGVPQYPPPGHKYPWQQSSDGVTGETSAPTGSA